MTVSVGVTALKVAVTVLLAVSAMVQVAPPGVSQPLQPAKVDPAAAAAVSAIDVPRATASLQSVPQEMPGPVAIPTSASFATASDVVLLPLVVAHGLGAEGTRPAVS